jgi:hypothetical protein
MSRNCDNLGNQYNRSITGNNDNKNELIIPRQRNEFQTVMQNEFNSGNLNPLHTPITTRYLDIDTRFRENLYTSESSNFTFTIPAPIRKVVSMQLSSYELPITFYGISSSYGNNYLNIKCTYKYPNRNQEKSQITLVVPDGNYTANDLIVLLNGMLRPLSKEDGSLLNTSLDSDLSIFNCVQFSLDINSNGSGSGKNTIAPTDDSNFRFSKSVLSIEMDFTLNINAVPDSARITSKIGWNLGYIKPIYSGKSTYESDTLPDTASMRYIYLVVNDFNNSVNNTFVGAFSNLTSYNILARIPLNGPYFNILMENDLSQHLEPRKYFGPVDIQRIQLQILDDHGRILNLNKANYSICLMFKTLYD